MIGIVGAPGAGKNTQTELLAEYIGCPWFSHGMLIREYATGQARQDMLEGKIIDDAITLEYVDKALKKVDTKNSECIIEGGPRTLTQAKWWEAKVATGAFKVTGIIHLTADEKLIRARLAKRGRLDDKKATIEKRFAEYRTNTKEALEYLKAKGMAVHDINADGTPEEVNNRIRQTLVIKTPAGVKTS